MRVYSTDNGWGLFKDESGEGRVQTHRYRRTYTWNSRNQLVSSVDANYSTSYVYGQDGQRSNKYTQGSETLYFNKMWSLHTDNGNSVYGGQYAKNVYLGETRIVTKLARADQKTAHEEMYKQYYYHSDHLGSATMISDWEGKEYQRIEYTPYGETWVEKTNNSGSEFLPYKFTGKEVDQETGLYYYGARYLDPKYSMWISCDPALGEYIPEMGKGNAKDSGSLPGMGGVFNHINGNLYAYAANNPIKYTDPDGISIMPISDKRLLDAIIFLYTKSKTFKQQFDRLLSKENSINQKAVTIFSTGANRYPGNTQTNDSPIYYDAEMFCLNDKGEIERYIEPKTNKEVQAIFVNIDIDKIYEKQLDLFEVISEEVCHAADTMNYGSIRWNEKCKKEDAEKKYMERPREIYAKLLTKKIMKEIYE